MSSELTDRARNRLERLTEVKSRLFTYQRLRDAVVAELEDDQQLFDLIMLSERARQLVEVRGVQRGYSDPIRTEIAEFGAVVDEQIHRRANEVVSELCASYLRQDARWEVDEPDCLDMTEAQASMDAIQESLRRLDDHEDIVQRLDLTYPEDKW
jgi:hypothetical protein